MGYGNFRRRNIFQTSPSLSCAVSGVKVSSSDQKNMLLVPRLTWRFNWRDTITETLVCPDGEQFKEPTMCIKHARMWKKLNVLKDVDQRGDLVQ